MAVLDHDHHLATEERSPGSVAQFCLFWFGVFGFIGLLTVLFSH